MAGGPRLVLLPVVLQEVRGLELRAEPVGAAACVGTATKHTSPERPNGTGMRVGELERLTWGDVDEARGRWCVSAGASKTGRARWVRVPADLFAAGSELVPRDDRTPERPVFHAFGADRFRTALTRACTA